MSHVSYTELRANLAKYMDEVCDTHAALHITRQNARTVVMLSEEEYEGMLGNAASPAEPGERGAPSPFAARAPRKAR